MEESNSEEHQGMVGQFSRLRVFAIPSIPPLHPISTAAAGAIPKSKHNKMDGLAHDLTSALEESTRSSASSSSSKRKFFRRRCKSTSNLSTVTSNSQAALVGGAGAGGSQQSGDSSTSSLEDNLGRGLSSRGERGTSSLQLSDSDEAAMAVVASASTSSSLMRKKRSESWNSARANSISKPGGGGESDSHNEASSPAVRPNTKRKRKFKRMAIDPAAGVAAVSRPVTRPVSETAPTTPSGTIKRKKVRSKSAAESDKNLSAGAGSVMLPSSSTRVIASKSFTPVRQRQMSGVVAGKRKRSTREKSVENDLGQRCNTILGKTSIKDGTMECDDDEDRRSSSSLSSTEWEDQDSGAEGGSFGHDDDEADDEQSDWHESGGQGTVFLLTDDEDSSDFPLSLFGANKKGISSEMQMESFNKLTSTARQAYLARMKRLAECVPGREIRAGTRRIRNRQSGFTIKSSSSEQLSRFLQDPSRTQLRLSILRSSDRNKIVHLANLYSLSIRYEEPHLLVLSKTGKTVKVDEFLVPKIPAVKPPIDVKRRRRTPPPSSAAGTATTDESSVQDADTLVMDDEELDVCPQEDFRPSNQLF